MKTYTIVCIFSLAECDPLNECWIANFADHKNAVRAFRFKMKECGALQSGDTVDVSGEKWSVEKLFENMLTTGCCYETTTDDALNRWFVRGEFVHDSYDENAISFD